jgi:uncharacterized OsmC-like protein
LSLVDLDKVRTDHELEIERLRDDASAHHLRPKVTTRLVRDLTMETSFSQFGATFDLVGVLAAAHGGPPEGPSPLRYFLAGIAFCVTGWWAKGSAVLGHELDSLELDVQSYVDARGEHGFPGIETHPKWIALEARISSDASPSDILALIDWGNDRCPLVGFARLAVPVYERIIHQGTTIRDTVPPGL